MDGTRPQRSDPELPDRHTPTFGVGIASTMVALLVVAAMLRLWAAAPNPGPNRFWDERYLTANTARALEAGWTRTQNVYYPGLGHLPTAAILVGARALGVDEDSLLVSPRQLGPLGYRVARTVSVFWGVTSILFVFLLATRLAGGPAGLIAASILAVTPWHLRQSILYKPDIALCALVAVTLWACLRLLEHDTVSRWLVLWGSAALAVSAKWNAAPLLVPIAMTVAVRIRQTGAHDSLRRCVPAVAAGILLIAALNPTLLRDPGAYVRDLSKTATHYEGRAEKADASHWQMPLHAAESLGSNDFLGAPLAALGLVGLAWFCLFPRPRRRQADPTSTAVDPLPDARLAWRIVATWPLAYVLTYTLATAYPSPHNWLPILPVLAAGCGAAAVAAIGAAGSRGGRFAALAAALVIALLFAHRAREVWRLTVQEAVPTTAQEAERLLAEAFGDGPGDRGVDGRVVVSSIPLHDRLSSFAVQSRTLDPRQPRLLTLPLDEGAVEPASSADAAVWRPGELSDGTSDNPTCRLPDPDGGRSATGRLVEIRARPLRVRGETLCAWLRPWSRRGRPVRRALAPEAGAPVTIASAPLGARPDWIVVDLVLTGADPDALPHLVLDPDGASGVGEKREISCHLLRVAGRRVFCRTERFLPPRDGGEVRLAGPFRRGRATVHRWRPPEPGS